MKARLGLLGLALAATLLSGCAHSGRENPTARMIRQKWLAQQIHIARHAQDSVTWAPSAPSPAPNGR